MIENMIQTFESRQLFSVAVDTALTPTSDPAVEQPAIVVDASAAKAGTGKVTFHDLSFVHKVDKASPVLM
jgi:hypothetical protein